MIILETQIPSIILSDIHDIIAVTWWADNIDVLFHISSKFDFFIGVDMVMCHALICVKEIHQSLTS
jgi:hypothetical protein